MKTPATIPATWSRSTRPSRTHAITLGCALLGAALLAQAASPCPPGYRQKASQCIPGPAQPQSLSTPTVAPGGIGPVVVKPKTPVVEKKIADPLKQPSQPNPGPLHASASVTTFAQDKQALNPQPIPPGHAPKTTPHPGAPIDAKSH